MVVREYKGVCNQAGKKVYSLLQKVLLIYFASKAQSALKGKKKKLGKSRHGGWEAEAEKLMQRVRESVLEKMFWPCVYLKNPEDPQVSGVVAHVTHQN